MDSDSAALGAVHGAELNHSGDIVLNSVIWVLNLKLWWVQLLPAAFLLPLIYGAQMTSSLRVFSAGQPRGYWRVTSLQQHTNRLSSRSGAAYQSAGAVSWSALVSMALGRKRVKCACWAAAVDAGFSSYSISRFSSVMIFWQYQHPFAL